MTVVLYVRGTPRPQPRGRHVGGKVVSTTGKNAKLWRAAVARCAYLLSESDRKWLESMKGKPIAIDHVFWFETKDAERWGKFHTQKPDRDNLDKLMLDTLRKSKILPNDDSYVADGRITKLWSATAAVMTTLRDPYTTEAETLSQILFQGEFSTT